MHVSVLYFAVLRERLGADRQDLNLPGGSSVQQAIAALSTAHPELAALLPRVQTAVNRVMAPPSWTLKEGDELALIPPVAGGGAGAEESQGTAPPRPVRITVRAEPLSLQDVVAAVEGADQGGVVTFTGVVRRHGQQPRVQRLEYEAYQAMAEDVLRAIAAEIERERPGARVAIHHRIGVLLVGEIAVAIAASAPHRAEAFAACRDAIDRLKERAPIWKKEIGEDGSEWVGMGP